MRNTPEYRIWVWMKQRCNNPNNTGYHKYGGRGIKVCKRWLRFESFYRDMGDRPKGLTLERINNSKGYFPDNCKWATWKEQANNSRKNVVIEYKGVKLTMAQWAEKLKINYRTLRYRLRIAHWPIEKALTMPIKDGQSFA